MTSTLPRPPRRDALDAYRLFSILTVVATIGLIAAGSIVRTSGSGLGCPDWPLCHGQVLPPFERTAMIEWSHRTVAAVTGAMILVTAAWTWRRFRADRLRAAASIAIVPLLAVQAALGREAVVRELPPLVVATHLLTGMLLLAALVVVATPRTVQVWPVQARPAAQHAASRDRLWPHTRIALVASAATLALGAVMVAHGAAYACSSWPGCAEAPLPWQGTEQHLLQWLHRGATLLGLLAAVNLAVQAYRVPPDARIVRFAGLSVLGLYALQALLGAVNVLWQPASARVAHLVVAAVIWAVVVALAAAGCPHVAPRRPGARDRRQVAGDAAREGVA